MTDWNYKLQITAPTRDTVSQMAHHFRVFDADPDPDQGQHAAPDGDSFTLCVPIKREQFEAVNAALAGVRHHMLIRRSHPLPSATATLTAWRFR